MLSCVVTGQNLHPRNPSRGKTGGELAIAKTGRSHEKRVCPRGGEMITVVAKVMPLFPHISISNAIQPRAAMQG